MTFEDFVARGRKAQEAVDAEVKRAPKKKRGPRQLSADEQKRRWNLQHPSGTPVSVTRGDGQSLIGVTTDTAYVDENGVARVWTDTHVDSVLLSRVKAIPPEGK